MSKSVEIKSRSEAKWGPWLNWSGCSKQCAGGVRRRRRMGYGPGANFEVKNFGRIIDDGLETK